MAAGNWRARLDVLRTLSARDRFTQCNTWLETTPRCALSRYMTACYHFDQGQPAHAVQAMMVAHHSTPALESAALLVFAGLNWVERRETPLLDILVGTWDEFRRPEFDRTGPERQLLDALAEPGTLPRGSQLAQRLWRLPLETVRRQLQQVATEQNRQANPLLLVSA